MKFSEMPVTEDADVPPVPAGFDVYRSRGAFSIHNGPAYRATAKGDMRSGLRVLNRHCNGMGFMHGGMISAFCDSALAWAIYHAAGGSMVTIKLTMEFMDIVQEGTWIEAHPEVTGQKGDLVHATARLVKENGTLFARADATFRKLRRKRD